MNKTLITMLIVTLMLLQITLAVEPFGQDITPRVVFINEQKVTEEKYTSSDVPLKSNQEITIGVRLKNNGVAGCQRLEAGIYDRTDVDNWYPKLGFLSYLNYKMTLNCDNSQSYVQTKEICGNAGETGLVSFRISAPEFQKGEKYSIIINSYECCYYDTVDGKSNVEGAKCSLTKTDSNYFTGQFTRVDLSNTQPNFFGGDQCNDGKKNNDETDIDCGGNSCSNKCKDLQFCHEGADCASQWCSEGICKSLPSCGDGKQNGDETGVDCGGSKCSACVVAQQQQGGSVTTDGTGKLKGIDFSQKATLLWIYVGLVIVGFVLFYYTSFTWAAVTFILLGALLFLLKLILG